MKDFIIRDYEKFKIQILEVFCYIREFSEQFNSQTFLTMCLWSCLGIAANIFYLSNIINTRAIQEIYEVIFWIGWGLYLLLLIVFISLRLNVFKLSYLQKIGIIVITSILLLMSIFNTSKMIPVSFSYQGKIHWSVEVSLYSELFILVAIIFFSYGINKIFSNTNLDTINGIKLDNTVIDVLWGERNDLTPEQIDLIDSVIEKIEEPIFIDIVKSTIIDSLRFNGRSTLRQWNLFNIYWSFLLYNLLVAKVVSNQALMAVITGYIIYITIVMMCRRLVDSNSSIFWILLLPIPFINIYLFYLLYVKTSAIYDAQNNKVIYYPL